MKALTPGTVTGILYIGGKGRKVEKCILDAWNVWVQVLGAGTITVVDTIIRNSAGGEVHREAVAKLELASGPPQANP